MISQIAAKLIAKHKEDPHTEQKPVEPSIIKTHHTGKQRSYIGIKRIVSRTYQDDKRDSHQNPRIAKQTEL